jgi:hypothetical protein
LEVWAWNPRACFPIIRERFFRAGHAHAGVLLVRSLAYFDRLGRADYFADITIDARRPQPIVNN